MATQPTGGQPDPDEVAAAIQDRQTYLGDSVYATYDGYHVILTTENGLLGDPSNTVFLEPPVLDALMRYVKKL